MSRQVGLEHVQGRIVSRLERGGRYPRWVLITALTGMFATTFPVTILTVSLGDIARDFDTSETLLAWVISAPMLASAIVLPILGKMGDLYGHRRVFLSGFALATVVAAVTAAAWNAPALIGFRTIAQVIGAATQPTSMALIMSVFAAEDRVKAMGWWSLVAAGAPAVGLVVGGPLVDALGWRLLFLVQAGLAFVALSVATAVLQETGRRARVRFDVAGSATLALGTGGLMLFLNQGPQQGWLAPAVVAGAVVAPIGLVTFVRAERRARDPLLPLVFLRRRNFTAPTVSGFLAGSAYMGGFILTPLLLRFVFEYSLSATAFIMLLRPLTYSLSSPVGGHMGTRVGERVAAVTGTALVATALGLLAIGAGTESLAVVVVALVAQGMGNGLSRPSLTASMANAVGEGNFGIAGATGRMAQQVGASFGITVLTAVYGGINEPGSFARAYVVGAVLGAGAVIAATFIRAIPRGGAGEQTTTESVDREVFTDAAS